MNVLRYLPRFRKAYNAMSEMRDREQWSRGDIDAFQLMRLNELWGHVVQNVRLYRRLAAKLGLPPSFSSLEDFKSRVPILRKSTVRTRSPELISDQPAAGRWHRTGGSTGAPMRVYWSNAAHQETLRCKYLHEAAFGLDVFDKKIFLWGHNESFAPGIAGSVKRAMRPIEDWMRNRRRLSAYSMGPESCSKYLQHIGNFRPKSIYGYSSAVYLLAQQATKDQVSLETLQLCILTAEPAFPNIVSTVEAEFRVPAVTEYGSVECGVIATEGSYRKLKVREDMCLVETLPVDGGGYELIVTVLNNPSFPLLRYAIGDETDQPLLLPSRGFAELTNIAGRTNDFLVSMSGSRVHPNAVKNIIEQDLTGRFRAVQKENGSLVLTVESDEPLSRQLSDRWIHHLRELLEGQPVEVDFVGSLPASRAGKHRWVVSEVTLRQNA